MITDVELCQLDTGVTKVEFCQLGNQLGNGITKVKP